MSSYTTPTNSRKDTSRLIPLVNGGVCAGFLISLGPRGVEAYSADEKLLGVFPDVIAAATAVEGGAK
jgi:hypothetical protein